MADAAKRLRMTASEYLVWEQAQRDKHEFHDGEVFAMTGASMRHNALANALVAALGPALRERGCRTLSSDQKVAQGQNRFVYPDVTVICGAPVLRPGTTDVLENPTAIAEVLSRTTEAYHRGDKLGAYRGMPSVMDILLVHQEAAWVEHYRRIEGGWHLSDERAGGAATLTGGAAVSIDALYEGVFALPSDEPATPQAS